MEYLPLLMFALVCLALFIGYPVAFSLAGTALIFGFVGQVFGFFDETFLYALPRRIFGVMNNQILLAVPLFVFMGVMLEKSKISESLLSSMANLFGKSRSGLGISVVLVGMLLAASTGIVGATVVTMGLMSLPVMLKRGYPKSYATGLIAATGSLGQIIPPSIALVLLGEVLSNSYQKSQIDQGVFSPETISVGDLFAGAILPGLILVVMYILYSLWATLSIDKKKWQESLEQESAASKQSIGSSLISGLVPPLLLILLVLGTILSGSATPTEAAGIGAFGAVILALQRRCLTIAILKEVMTSTLKVTSMIFLILIGASVFSLVFRGLGGEELITSSFAQLPGGVIGATILVMLGVFLLGFILDFIEITFVVVPIVAPVLFTMGLDPIWFGILLAVNLQTSFLTPPFGFALFYLRGVAPSSVQTMDIYRGAIPFVLMQLSLLVMLFVWPELATWLPSIIYQ